MQKLHTYLSNIHFFSIRNELSQEGSAWCILLEYVQTHRRISPFDQKLRIPLQCIICCSTDSKVRTVKKAKKHSLKQTLIGSTRLQTEELYDTTSNLRVTTLGQSHVTLSLFQVFRQLGAGENMRRQKWKQEISAILTSKNAICLSFYTMK